jgi:hypothetical protein
MGFRCVGYRSCVSSDSGGTNNWSIAFDFSGVATNFVDTKIANSPFYDNGNTGYNATTDYFDDIPKRPRIGLTNYNGTPITWLGEASWFKTWGRMNLVVIP